MGRYDSDNFDDFFNNTADNIRGQRTPQSSQPVGNQRKRVDVDYSFHNDEIYNDEDYDDNEYDDDSEYYDDSYDEYDNTDDYGTDDYDEDIYNRRNSRETQNNKGRSRNRGASNPEEKKMKKKFMISKRRGMFITTIQLIISIIFMVFLFINKENIIVEYNLTNNLIIGGVLAILYVIPLFMQFRGLMAKLFGKIISIIVSIILVLLMIIQGTIGNDILSLGGNEKVTSREPFVVYLSGTDSMGELSTTSNGRSDTNILAVVNPKTSTILLLTTPRDSYLELLGDDIPTGNYDKLTHAGIYGTGTKNSEGSWKHGYNVSMKMLSNLYDIDIEHYVRINFTGFINLVDAVGGVDIDVPEAFSRYEFDKWFEFAQGPTHMDGYYALTFVRERKSFANGDFQRGQNQTLFIKSMINQVVSTNTITNYSKIIDAIDTSFETDLNIASLASIQTSLSAQGKGNWNIVNYSTTGTTGDGYQLCYTTGSYLSVVKLDDDSIEVAKKLVSMVMNGETVTDTTADAIANGTLEGETESTSEQE